MNDEPQRLYVQQGFSAAKIAKLYGLKYKIPKVAESTVLYQLKRDGIKRRTLNVLPIRHLEKVEKVQLARRRAEAISRNACEELGTEWERLLDRIRMHRDEFVHQA